MNSVKFIWTHLPLARSPTLCQVLIAPCTSPSEKFSLYLIV